jgi:hypothetical protein
MNTHLAPFSLGIVCIFVEKITQNGYSYARL